MDMQHNIETPLQLVRRIVDTLEKHEKQLTKALKYGGNAETFDQLCARALSGELHVHTLPNSVVLCELSTYGNGTAYHVYIAAGDLTELMEFSRGKLISVAKAYGCNMMSGSGRPGWEKALKGEGWKRLRVTFVKEIPDG